MMGIMNVKAIKTIFLISIIILSITGLVIISGSSHELEIVTKARLMPKLGDYNTEIDYFYVDDFLISGNYTYLCGHKTHTTKLFLAKFSDNGTMEWYKIFNESYGYSYNQYAALITVDSSSNIYFLTTRHTQGNDTGMLVLLKLAPNSTVLWEKYLGTIYEFKYFYTIMQMSDNAILIVANTYLHNLTLLKLNLDGATIWTHTEAFGDNAVIVTTKTLVVNSTIYTLVVKKNAPTAVADKNLILFKFSSEGQRLSYKTLVERYSTAIDLKSFKYSADDSRLVFLFSNNTLYKMTLSGQIEHKFILPRVDFYYYQDIAIDDTTGELYAVRGMDYSVDIVKLDESLNYLHTFSLSFDKKNDTVSLGYNHAVFVKNGYLYLAVSVGKSNHHIWAYFFKMHERISPAWLSLTTALTITLIASIVLLLYNVKKNVQVKEQHKTS